MFSLFKQKSGPPDAASVIKRFVILRHISAKGRIIPPPDLLASVMATWSPDKKRELGEQTRKEFAKVVQQLEASGLWKEMNQNERRFMKAGMSEVDAQALVDISWFAEPMACLAWALIAVTDIPPYDQQADLKTLDELFSEPLPELLSKVSLRPEEEVQKQRDLAELWHWRSRTRQLQESGRMPARIGGKLTIEEVIQMSSSKAAENGAFAAPIGNDFPAFGKPYRELSSDEYATVTSIAMERHRAFNWLCGRAPKNRWADTPTET